MSGTDDDSESVKSPPFIPPDEDFLLPSRPGSPVSPPSSPPHPVSGHVPSTASRYQSGKTDEYSPPAKQTRTSSLSPRPGTLYERASASPYPSTSSDQDREAMPPPPTPQLRRPAPPRLTTMDVVTIFSVNSILLDRDLPTIRNVVDPDRYERLMKVKAIKIIHILGQHFSRSTDNYYDKIDDYVEYVLCKISSPAHGEDEDTIHLRTFEETRSRYFSLMVKLSGSFKKKIINPTYHWGHLASIILVNAAIAREMVKLPGRRNLYSDLLGWCVYFFKAWHIDIWLENKGGWETIVEDNEKGDIFREVCVVTHPLRESTPSPRDSPQSSPSTSTWPPPELPSESPASPSDPESPLSEPTFD